MENYLQRFAATELMDILEANPDIEIEAAIDEIVKQSIHSSGFGVSEADIRKMVESEASNFTRRGVLNPSWLKEQRGVEFYFYLVNSQAGWLRHVIQYTKNLEEGISHYVLYGVWDSLIILGGNTEDAKWLSEKIDEVPYNELIIFKASAIPFFYSHKTAFHNDRKAPVSANITDDRLVDIIRNYDTNKRSNDFKSLKKINAVLGGFWEYRGSTDVRINAFVGIKTGKGSHKVTAEEVVDQLLMNVYIRQSLHHLFEVESGHPFNYIAKIVCRNMNELDFITDEISKIRVHSVRLDGSTFITSSENEHLNSFYPNRPKNIASTKLVFKSDLNELLNNLSIDLNPSGIEAFNELNENEQLDIFVKMTALNKELNDNFSLAPLPVEFQTYITEVKRNYLESNLTNNKNLAISSITILTSLVENYSRKVLISIFESWLGTDYRNNIEFKNLGLTTSNISKFSLGNCLHSFRGLQKYTDKIPNNFVLDYANFTKNRNEIIHSNISGVPAKQLVQNTHELLLSSARILLELYNLLISVPVTSTVVSAIEKQDVEVKDSHNLTETVTVVPEVFLSYTHKNKTIANQLAADLRKLGISLFLDEWDIKFGDSISSKINEALERSAFFVPLFSRDYMKSSWAGRELNTALSKQLGRGTITIIPIKLDDCSLPPLLEDIKYITLNTDDYNDALLALAKSILYRRLEDNIKDVTKNVNKDKDSEKNDNDDESESVVKI